MCVVAVPQSHRALIISKYILCNVSMVQPSSINYMPLCAAKLVFLESGGGGYTALETHRHLDIYGKAADICPLVRIRFFLSLPAPERNERVYD